jgi:hypothetical protein
MTKNITKYKSTKSGGLIKVSEHTLLGELMGIHNELKKMTKLLKQTLKETDKK